MGIKKFDDIQAWQQAREITNLIYSIKKDKPFNRDFRLASKIQSGVYICCLEDNNGNKKCVKLVVIR